MEQRRVSSPLCLAAGLSASHIHQSRVDFRQQGDLYHLATKNSLGSDAAVWCLVSCFSSVSSEQPDMPPQSAFSAPARSHPTLPLNHHGSRQCTTVGGDPARCDAEGGCAELASELFELASFSCEAASCFHSRGEGRSSRWVRGGTFHQCCWRLQQHVRSLA